MLDGAPRYGVVVVNHRSADLLRRYLAATAAGLDDAVVVVVDNSPGVDDRAAARAVVEEHGWELVTAPNDGFGAGVNRGVAHALALGVHAVLVLNPDLALAPAGAAALLAAAAREPDVLLSPVVVDEAGRVWFGGGALDLRRGSTRAGAGAVGDGAVDWLSGACLASSAAAWRRVGGFDPAYFMYWEDVDLSWRARAAGLRLAVRDDVVATHAVGGTQEHAGSRRRSDLYYVQNCRNRLLFAGLHLGLADRLRWVLRAPWWARRVLLRGGRRQLLESPRPLLSVVGGTLGGVREALRPRRRAPRAHVAPGRAGGGARRLVVAHPSTELYGADLQMLETLRAARADGWDVELVLPGEGPLAARAAALGVQVTRADLPVLRKALLHPARLPGLAVAAARAVVRTTRTLRRTPPDAVYVSTLTIPWWVAAARLARVPVLCHVHEAEEDQPRVVTAALTAPLLLADRVVTNSAAARRSIGPVFRSLAERAVVVHNGVPGPAATPAPPAPGGPLRVVLVGRLSPRKGTDVALEAVAQAVARGHDVRLRVAGSTFTGYEWFERDLRARLDEPALAGRVELLGFVHPTWPLLAEADVVLVPSRVEPFGNTAVEAMLAARAVVASRVQGLAEIVRDGETGLLVPPGDAAALADALGRLAEDPALRARLATAARADAVARFSTERYAAAVRAELDRLASRGPATEPAPALG